MKNKCAPIGRCPYANRVEFLMQNKLTYWVLPLSAAAVCLSHAAWMPQQSVCSRRQGAVAVHLWLATRSRKPVDDKESQANTASRPRLLPPNPTARCCFPARMESGGCRTLKIVTLVAMWLGSKWAKLG
jgi:hypothetical protein